MSHWIPISRIHFASDRGAPRVTIAGADIARAEAARADAAKAAAAGGSLAAGHTARHTQQARRKPSDGAPRTRVRGANKGSGVTLSNLFYLTNERGEVVLTERGECRTYESSKPTGAANKAFRVFVRSEAGRRSLEEYRRAHHHDSRPLAESDMGLTPSMKQALSKMLTAAQVADALAVPLPRTVEAAIISGLERDTLTWEEAAKYRAAYWDNDRALYTFLVDVYVAKAGGSSIRRYQVGYMPLLKPNMHEIKKGINKIAKATHIPKTRSMPPAWAAAANMDKCVSHHASPTRRRKRSSSPTPSPARKRARRGSAA